ncbi:MAG: riboflavin synthase [Spirosomataceae bacterium]|jgi:riboflavin synthase
MFTGIIENTAQLLSFEEKGSNVTFKFRCELTPELKIDQSVSHNGVCLTVDGIADDKSFYTLTAIEETLKKTNLGNLKIGNLVNLERCMLANGRFDGHIVQGHVDQTGICSHIEEKDGSWELRFTYDENQGNITVEKGSICINGTSLTVFNSTENAFSVAIIPYTWEHTNIHLLKVGSSVNLEFDILGKYMQRILSEKLR